MEALEQIPERYEISLADFLGQLDALRDADTSMRSLSEDEFLRGKERVRDAVRRGAGCAEPRSNWLDLLVLR
jgi:hypothetical protein